MKLSSAAAQTLLALAAVIAAAGTVWTAAALRASDRRVVGWRQADLIDRDQQRARDRAELRDHAEHAAELSYGLQRRLLDDRAEMERAQQQRWQAEMTEAFDARPTTEARNPEVTG